MLASIALLYGLASARLATAAEESQVVRVTSGVQYQLLERWDVDRLNEILQVGTQKFSGISVTFSPARNGVRLYRITYSSVIPERGNKPSIATGLLAIPETSDKAFPVVSYQHGTATDDQHHLLPNGGQPQGKLRQTYTKGGAPRDRLKARHGQRQLHPENRTVPPFSKQERHDSRRWLEGARTRPAEEMIRSDFALEPKRLSVRRQA